MDPVTAIGLVIFLVVGTLGVIGSAATVEEARKRRATRPSREELDPGEAQALYAEAQSSSSPERVEDIAEALYSGGRQILAGQVRAALNRYYAALSSTTEEARTHYWEIVGAGFVGLANRVATQRPSVLAG